MKIFAKSKYYIGFTKFGKYILNVNAIDPEKFIDFVIRVIYMFECKFCGKSFQREKTVVIH